MPILQIKSLFPNLIVNHPDYSCLKVLVASVVSESLGHVLKSARLPQSLGFSRQENGGGVDISFSKDLPDLGMAPRSPAL